MMLVKERESSNAMSVTPSKADSHHTETLTEAIVSLYTFCEPKTFSGKACLICQEKFSSDEQVKKHFRSKEHIQNFSLQNKLPHQTAKWWEQLEGESDIQHFLRIDIATAIGPLPSYIKCIFAKGILFGNLWEVIPRDF